MTMRDPREGRPGAQTGSASHTAAGAESPRATPGAQPTVSTSGSARGETGVGGGSPQAGASSLLPALTAPTGGGAIRGIGEKFAVNAATGTASLGVPLPVSAGRSGFGPLVGLSYDSGAGNGPFGLGFHLAVPTVTRKTDKGLPRYYDEEESDEYILSGAEDLVPLRDAAGAIVELTRGR